MSIYQANFYREDAQIKTLLDDNDYSNDYPIKTFIYGSGSKNISLGIPMDETSTDAGGPIKRVLPCSCVIYSMRGQFPNNYTNYDELYCDGEDNYEFVEEISCGEDASAFLTSKGRVLISGNSNYHDASTIPSFIYLSFSDPIEITNTGMVVELNLEVVREKEGKLFGKLENYVFGVKQAWVISSGLFIVTKFGLVWLLSRTYEWTLLKFLKNDYKVAKIKYITSGIDHMMALSEDGELFSARHHNHGTGIKTVSRDFEITKVNIPLQSGDSILDAYASYNRTLVVTKFGKVFINDHGTGLINNIITFSLLKPMEETGEKVIKVALGGLHSIFLCESGNCWAIGYNRYKQCGIEGNNIALPTLIPLPKKIKDVFCGWYFSILETIDGEFLGAGNNASGELSSIPLSNETEIIPQFTPLQLPKPPVNSSSKIVWRIYVNSLSFNLFFMARLVLSKRTQWMKQNLKSLSKNPHLSDITILLQDQHPIQTSNL